LRRAHAGNAGKACALLERIPPDRSFYLPRATHSSA
jgi:hypothetical protein